MNSVVKPGMVVTFYWDQKGTDRAISKAAAGVRGTIWGKHRIASPWHVRAQGSSCPLALRSP
jgi:hypothetical protein